MNRREATSWKWPVSALGVNSFPRNVNQLRAIWNTHGDGVHKISWLRLNKRCRCIVWESGTMALKISAIKWLSRFNTCLVANGVCLMWYHVVNNSKVNVWGPGLWWLQWWIIMDSLRSGTWHGATLSAQANITHKRSVERAVVCDGSTWQVMMLEMNRRRAIGYRKKYAVVSCKQMRLATLLQQIWQDNVTNYS